MAALRERLGLDRPMLVRYFEYMLGLCRGDLGTSAISGASVMQLFWEKFPSTMLLALAATVVNLSVSLPLGIYSARHNGSLADNIAVVGG